MQLFERKKKPPFINLTPLIDILFLLIIFFVVSSRLVDESGVQLELPTSGQAEKTTIELPILVIAKTGELLLDNQILQTQELILQLQQLATEKPDQPIILQIDQAVSHGRVIQMMDYIKSAGIKRIIFGTQAPEQ